jgi:tRNA threonylcarbamoyladenosine modification (KEOPS) complex  Pcc1 subunit
LAKEETLNESSLSDFTSELTLKSSDSKKIFAAYNAIKPETSVIISQRGKTEIFMENEFTIKMKFYSADFISLRAMLGSYLRWLEVAFSSLSDFEQKK